MFSDEELMEALKAAKTGTASGPDGFPGILCKKLHTSITKPLGAIFRESLETGEIPKRFTEGTITPIFKGGDRSLPENYRPVCVTSTIMRCFEKIVKQEIIRFLEQYNILKPSQHGFRAGRSCLSQLIEHYDSILENLEENKGVEVVYLDFAKCFDKIDHGVLLHKIKKIGIGGTLGTWIMNFLTQRTQKVKVGQTLSEEVKVTSGVGQGTCTGPIWMLIMNHDIDESIVHSLIKNFADDAKISKGISNREDFAKFQSDLTNVYGWANSNNVQFNVKKFVLLTYGQKEPDLKVLDPEGNEIKPTTSTRDLGVTMESSGDFNEHISKISSEGRKLTGMVLRTFITRDPDVLLRLYKTIILPKLDYCSQLWSPSKIKQIREIEQVQRNFTKYINGCTQDDDYWDRLKKLNLYSVERRRERYTCIYVWKILQGIVPNPGINFEYNERRGWMVKIKGQKKKNAKIANLYENSFVIRGGRLFNSLPKEIRNWEYQVEESTEHFKAALDEYLRAIPDEPNATPAYSKRIGTLNNSGQKTNSLIFKTRELRTRQNLN